MDKAFDISELLLQKSFRDLNEREREFVLSELKDEAEYNELRNIVLTSKDEAPFNENSKRNILDAFDREFGSKAKSINQKRNYWPYIAAAATVAIILTVSIFLFKNQENKLAELKQKKTEEIIKNDSASSSKIDLEQEKPEVEETQEAQDSEIEKSPETNQIAELKDERNVSQKRTLEMESAEVSKEDEPISIEETSKELAQVKTNAPDRYELDYGDKDKAKVSVAADEIKKMDDDVSSDYEALRKSAQNVPATSAMGAEGKAATGLNRFNNSNQTFKLKRINRHHYISY